MASIIDELINVLSRESEVYKELIIVAGSKANIIIKNNLEDLQEVTAKEQKFVEKIMDLEKKREEVVKNMALVLNKKADQLKLKNIIALLSNQEKEHEKLSKIYDELATSMKSLVEINSRNKMLIEESLEMVEFNMNLINSTRLSPASSTYNKSAFQDNNQANNTGSFDAIQ